MCNLYRMRSTQDEVRQLTKAFDRIGNMEPLIEVYPDRPAPVARNTAEGRELTFLSAMKRAVTGGVLISAMLASRFEG